MLQNIEHIELREMFRGAFQNLMLHKEYVDSLNVFPVPDGDTGTNMGLTMTATVKELDLSEPMTNKDTAKAFAKGALKGARGNSGVILSQIFKGMSEIIENAKIINTKTFAKALQNGANKAYDAVTQPKEGTILTVIRVVGEYAVRISSRTTDFLQFFDKILKKGNEILAETPKMLPILEKAGVVDSGGYGLIVILTGMYNILAGVKMEAIDLDLQQKQQSPIEYNFEDVHDLDTILFAYCTEFFVINLKNHITVADIDRMRDELSKIGDCVLVIGDLGMVKVHVHTNNPDKALMQALRLGELYQPKIENMLEQNRQLKEQKEKMRKKNGLMAISAGAGFVSIFKDLGVDCVMEGGQTMNPSVDDIVRNVKSINAENIFILPNNKNIILACEQAKELLTCNLVVVATVNVPEGVAAAMAFDLEAEAETLARNMLSAAKSIHCIQVTHAVRETEIDGFKVKNGDVIALEDGLIAKGKNVDAVVKKALSTKDADDICVITMYYGNNVTKESAEALGEAVQETYPDADVIVVCGGQPHYYYFISVE